MGFSVGCAFCLCTMARYKLIDWLKIRFVCARVCANAAKTVYSTRCRTWPSGGAANATATRHAAVCRHATVDSVASVDTIRSARTARGADRSTTTDRGPEPPRQEPTSALVSVDCRDTESSSGTRTKSLNDTASFGTRTVIFVCKLRLLSNSFYWCWNLSYKLTLPRACRSWVVVNRLLTVNRLTGLYTHG